MLAQEDLLPVNIAVILATGGKFTRQLNASKDALLALHGADKAHCAIHAAWDFDGVANRNIIAGPTGGGRRHVVGRIAKDRL